MKMGKSTQQKFIDFLIKCLDLFSKVNLFQVHCKYSFEIEQVTINKAKIRYFFNLNSPQFLLQNQRLTLIILVFQNEWVIINQKIFQ